MKIACVGQVCDEKRILNGFKEREMNKKALEYFKRNPLLYADMQECVENGEAVFLHADEKGVLLVHQDAGIFMLACEDEEQAGKILQKLSAREIQSKSGLIVAHGEPCSRAVKKAYPTVDDTACYQTVYLSKSSIPLAETLDFSLASEEDVEKIISLYDRESPKNLRLLQKSGKIICARLDSAMVGFIGRHPEGSMGLLYVFPEYRRRGFAFEIEAKLVNVILEEGRLPYGHIIVDNAASLALQQKLGFVSADGLVHWHRVL